MDQKSPSEKFFENGLQFECTRCSNCCRHEPGYVFLSEDDMRGIVNATGLVRTDVISTYCRRVDMGITTRISLKEKDNYDCVFWEESGCAIYRFRPLQCRSYPFWSAIVDTEESWERESRSCPGINRGKRYHRDKIEEWLRLREQASLLS